MNRQWAVDLLAASERKDEAQEKEFLRLVDEVEGIVTLEVARVLMKTYSDKPDYGTQERVESVLAGAKPEIVTQAILEELPRLIKDSPEWADSLVGTEVEFRPQLLERVAGKMSEEIKSALRSIVSRSDFKEFHPNAMILDV
jgi:hypothetical protein